LDFEPLPETEVVNVPQRFAFAREVAELFSLPEEMPR